MTIAKIDKKIRYYEKALTKIYPTFLHTKKVARFSKRIEYLNWYREILTESQKVGTL